MDEEIFIQSGQQRQCCVNLWYDTIMPTKLGEIAGNKNGKFNISTIHK